MDANVKIAAEEKISNKDINEVLVKYGSDYIDEVIVPSAVVPSNSDYNFSSIFQPIPATSDSVSSDNENMLQSNSEHNSLSQAEVSPSKDCESSQLTLANLKIATELKVKTPVEEFSYNTNIDNSQLHGDLNFSQEIGQFEESVSESIPVLNQQLLPLSNEIKTEFDNQNPSVDNAVVENHEYVKELEVDKIFHFEKIDQSTNFADLDVVGKNVETKLDITLPLENKSMETSDTLKEKDSAKHLVSQEEVTSSSNINTQEHCEVENCVKEKSETELTEKQPYIQSSNKILENGNYQKKLDLENSISTPNFNSSTELTIYSASNTKPDFLNETVNISNSNIIDKFSYYRNTDAKSKQEGLNKHVDAAYNSSNGKEITLISKENIEEIVGTKNMGNDLEYDEYIKKAGGEKTNEDIQKICFVNDKNEKDGIEKSYTDILTIDDDGEKKIEDQAACHTENTSENKNNLKIDEETVQDSHLENNDHSNIVDAKSKLYYAENRNPAYGDGKYIIENTERKNEDLNDLNKEENKCYADSSLNMIKNNNSDDEKRCQAIKCLEDTYSIETGNERKCNFSDSNFISTLVDDVKDGKDNREQREMSTYFTGDTVKNNLKNTENSYTSNIPIITRTVSLISEEFSFSNSDKMKNSPMTPQLKSFARISTVDEFILFNETEAIKLEQETLDVKLEELMATNLEGQKQNKMLNLKKEPVWFKLFLKNQSRIVVLDERRDFDYFVDKVMSIFFGLNFEKDYQRFPLKTSKIVAPVNKLGLKVLGEGRELKMYYISVTGEKVTLDSNEALLKATDMLLQDPNLSFIPVFCSVVEEDGTEVKDIITAYGTPVAPPPINLKKMLELIEIVHKNPTNDNASTKVNASASDAEHLEHFVTTLANLSGISGSNPQNYHSDTITTIKQNENFPNLKETKYLDALNKETKNKSKFSEFTYKTEIKTKNLQSGSQNAIDFEYPFPGDKHIKTETIIKRPSTQSCKENFSQQYQDSVVEKANFNSMESNFGEGNKFVDKKIDKITIKTSKDMPKNINPRTKVPKNNVIKSKNLSNTEVTIARKDIVSHRSPPNIQDDNDSAESEVKLQSDVEFEKMDEEEVDSETSLSSLSTNCEDSDNSFSNYEPIKSRKGTEELSVHRSRKIKISKIQSKKIESVSKNDMLSRKQKKDRKFSESNSKLKDNSKLKRELGNSHSIFSENCTEIDLENESLEFQKNESKDLKKEEYATKNSSGLEKKSKLPKPVKNILALMNEDAKTEKGSKNINGAPSQDESLIDDTCNSQPKKKIADKNLKMPTADKKPSEIELDYSRLVKVSSSSEKFRKYKTFSADGKNSKTLINFIEKKHYGNISKVDPQKFDQNSNYYLEKKIIKDSHKVGVKKVDEFDVGDGWDNSVKIIRIKVYSPSILNEKRNCDTMESTNEKNCMTCFNKFNHSLSKNSENGAVEDHGNKDGWNCLQCVENLKSPQNDNEEVIDKEMILEKNREQSIKKKESAILKPKKLNSNVEAIQSQIEKKKTDKIQYKNYLKSGRENKVEVALSNSINGNCKSKPFNKDKIFQKNKNLKSSSNQEVRKHQTEKFQLEAEIPVDFEVFPENIYSDSIKISNLGDSQRNQNFLKKEQLCHRILQSDNYKIPCNITKQSPDIEETHEAYRNLVFPTKADPIKNQYDKYLQGRKIADHELPVGKKNFVKIEELNEDSTYYRNLENKKFKKIKNSKVISKTIFDDTLRLKEGKLKVSNQLNSLTNQKLVLSDTVNHSLLNNLNLYQQKMLEQQNLQLQLLQQQQFFKQKCLEQQIFVDNISNQISAYYQVKCDKLPAANYSTMLPADTVKSKKNGNPPYNFYNVKEFQNSNFIETYHHPTSFRQHQGNQHQNLCQYTNYSQNGNVYHQPIFYCNERKMYYDIYDYHQYANLFHPNINFGQKLPLEPINQSNAMQSTLINTYPVLKPITESQNRQLDGSIKKSQTLSCGLVQVIKNGTNAMALYSPSHLNK
ncbi:hypothetical protein HK099_000592 [Clydaea vesicula]|uniref:Uncharacterized protein n=1 Tax=Clydaea vesicula TaxID=447962 RepID=A0AAD5U448_9FUNG|nr:hypothetical protein HK099_000592 [Clydaea vesicula]